jgi:hypothetical protein
MDGVPQFTLCSRWHYLRHAGTGRHPREVQGIPVSPGSAARGEQAVEVRRSRSAAREELMPSLALYVF